MSPEWINAGLSAMTILSMIGGAVAYYIRSEVDRRLAEKTHNAVNSGLTAVRDDNKALVERVIALERRLAAIDVGLGREP